MTKTRNVVFFLSRKVVDAVQRDFVAAKNHVYSLDRQKGIKFLLQKDLRSKKGTKRRTTRAREVHSNLLLQEIEKRDDEVTN